MVTAFNKNSDGQYSKIDCHISQGILFWTGRFVRSFVRTRSCFWRGNCLSARGRPPFLRSVRAGVELLDVELEEDALAGVEVPEVRFDEIELLDVEFDKAASAKNWREILDCGDVHRAELSLSFCCFLGAWSSIVLKRLRFACDEDAGDEDAGDEDAGDKDACDGGVVVKSESCLGACDGDACDGGVVVEAKSCLGACDGDACDGGVVVEAESCLGTCDEDACDGGSVVKSESYFGACDEDAGDKDACDGGSVVKSESCFGACDEDAGDKDARDGGVVVKSESCFGACCPKMSSSINAVRSRWHCDGESVVNGKPLLNFCCLLGAWSSTVLRRLRFACDEDDCDEDVFVKSESCFGACCSEISSSINALRSRWHCDGEFAVNGKPLLNFCCLTGPGSLAVELRLRFVAFRAISAPTVAIVLSSNENCMVKIRTAARKRQNAELNQ